MTNGLIAPRLGGFLLREIVMQRAPARMTGDVNTPPLRSDLATR